MFKTPVKLTVAMFSSVIALAPFWGKAQQIMSLEQAVALAQQNDPWLYGSKLKQSAMEQRSIASNTLPDPKVSLSMSNLPMDSWNIDQEGMTQVKLGISQMFPRGDSLAIQAEQLQITSTRFPLLRTDRKAKVKVLISELWLDAYLAQQTIELINRDRSLFEQMAEVAKASYSNVIGKTRQQDVIRAQLEIIKLEDRLTIEQQKFEVAISKLNQWLFVHDKDNADLSNFNDMQLNYRIAPTLPKITLPYGLTLKSELFSRNSLVQTLLAHPVVSAIDIKTKAAEKSIDLAKEQYQPQFGVNASYGYRDDMPSGESRSDLFSIGVSFDLPLFTENKQDKYLSASVAETEAIKTEKLLKVQQMMAAVESEVNLLRRLSERQLIYRDQLLRQTHEQAEASLTAYTNDDGDFSEVVRARIAELDAGIAMLKIDVDALKAVARINYYFAGKSHDEQLKQLLGE